MDFYFIKQIFVYSLAILFIGFIFQPYLVEAFLFRNLALGSRGEDVRQLQSFLNQSGSPVALTGIGSLGNESNFFGPLTLKAVAQYQNLYQSEILKPVNLISGTGFVGPLTRAHILKNLTQSSTTVAEEVSSVSVLVESTNFSPNVFVTSETESVSQVSPEAEINKAILNNSTADFFPVEPKRSSVMSIFSISPTIGNLNSSVIINGEGFLKENTVYAGNKVFYRLPSSNNGQTITIPIENTFTDIDLRRGPEAKGQLIIPLWIYVENESGVSNQAVFNLTLN